jgi:hypothetical protein
MRMRSGRRGRGGPCGLPWEPCTQGRQPRQVGCVRGLLGCGAVDIEFRGKQRELVDIRMLQSLLRTAACTGLSVATCSGLGGRPRGVGAPPSEPAALGRPPRSIVSELLPTQSARRRVPPPHAAKMLLMSESCFQFPCLPGKTGVHLTSPMIRSSSIQFRTAVSVRTNRGFVCKYPEILARPSSGQSYENADCSKPLKFNSIIALALFKISLNRSQTSS